MIILKRIASIAFALSFIMAINIFGGIGREYLSLQHARILFMVFGAIALLLNLLSFQTGKNSAVFNFLYWAGSIVAFIGLLFHQFHLPYSLVIIICGMGILGVSFVLPEGLERMENKKDDNVLDDL